MGVLAVYDTIGIQSYIFSSNKLAENVGASKLVANVFDKNGLLPTVIAKCTEQSLPDWREGGKLNLSLKAEIVYQGGGNSYVVFDNEETFQEVTKAFLIGVSSTAPGIGIAVAAIETDFSNYNSDFDKINKRLMLVKGGFDMPTFAGNQPITKQSNRTGLPVSIFRDNEYMSYAQMKKREKYANYKEKYESSINDFENLVFEKNTDSFIAIIHADGNNMGKHIKDFMEKSCGTYEEAVPKIRELAVKIDNCYGKARERTIKSFNEAYTAYVKKLNVKYPNKQYSTQPPIFELIGDGDDTTLVIGGRFALDFAARLLREIEKTPSPERPFEHKPTACAGVVLFHSHYPFSEAYKLAEGLCSNAKKPSRDAEGSYIDFHLHSSGNVVGLSQLRSKQYIVDGKTIIHRPWKVSAKCDCQTPSCFCWFEQHATSISKIPRNKLKAIRNAISTGDVAANLAENQLRDYSLPKFPQPHSDEISNYAALFDILEFHDTYVNLLNKLEVSHDNN